MIRPNLSLTPTEQARLDELTLKATLPSWLRTHVHDAADEIERLRAENERLRAEVEKTARSANEVFDALTWVLSEGVQWHATVDDGKQVRVLSHPVPTSRTGYWVSLASSKIRPQALTATQGATVTELDEAGWHAAATKEDDRD